LMVVDQTTPDTAQQSDGPPRKLNHGVHSIQGKRRTMEDSHFVWLNTNESAEHDIDAFFAVYDGHGGKKAADFVKDTFPPLVNCNLTKPPHVIGSALHDAFLEVENQCLQKALQDHWTDGTTATIALLKGNVLVVGNVGDSEAILCRDRQAIALTTIHNPQKNEDEKKRIVDEGGRLYHDRLAHPVLNPAFFNIAVSRSIGDVFFKHKDYVKDKPSVLIAEPSLKEIQLVDGDQFLVLACDGLFDVMKHQEIADFVLERLADQDMTQISKELVEIAYEKGSTDNITALIVDLRR